MKLAEAVALARAAKTRVQGALTALHRESQKPGLYNGLARTYRTVIDGDPGLPDESQLVQQVATDVIDELRRLLAERWDTEANVTANNANARADVVLDDGTIVISDAPATYLIFLEKSLEDVYTFIAKLPSLSPSETWAWDPARGVHASTPIETASEKRIPIPLVLVPATKEHPAQATTYDDVVVRGYWTTTKLSGALPSERKRELLLHVVALRDAVKTARERANQLTVTEWKPAAGALDYLLS